MIAEIDGAVLCSWDELVRQARAVLHGWHESIRDRELVVMTPRRGLNGIVDLIAAALHPGVVAVVPEGFLTTPAADEKGSSAGAELKAYVHVERGVAGYRSADLRIASAPHLAQRLRQREDAVYVASGGTTGAKKLGEIPVGQLSPMPSGYQVTGLTDSSVCYIGGVWTHSAFLWAFYCAFEGRLRVVVADTFRSASVARLIDTGHVTWALFPPAEFQALASLLDTQKWSPRTIENVVTTGGPTPPDSRQAWTDHLGASRVFDMYATTEGIGTLVASGIDQSVRPGTSGRPVWGRAEVRTSDGRRLTEPNVVGELFIKSLSRIRGALNEYRSAGDLARIDADGYVFLAGRVDEMVVVHGENIDVRALTLLLLSVRGVQDAAVVPLASDDEYVRGLGVAIVGALDISLLRRELTPIIGKRWGPTAVPRRWLNMHRLPTTANGKVDRMKIRERLLNSSATRTAEGFSSDAD
ncbi:AMP-binding protein [Promicromonospora kroppenstedtii]|uniref:AMP-binding protein n=1 Tax=Promicromonospora kroppenstedtii TaxID=440482 RepID=UPI000A07239C|nr:AMP-binding protein [Promicromonospora kroppenstedtii]